MRNEWYLIVGLIVYFLFVKDAPVAPIEQTVTTSWVVEVKGEVHRPGVFSVTPGTRVYEVIEKAGGLKDSADTRLVTLSAEVSDAMVIHVRPYDTIASTLININQASVSELMMLPGFGVTRSQDLIDHRNTHGPFQRIEDIINVKGIGQATFDAIKDLIITG
jgi:competence protein ComEA